MTTILIYFVAALLLALSSSSSSLIRTVTAFAPTNIYSNITPTSATQIFASTTIVEAEDMYLEKAIQSEGGVLEKPDVIYMIVYNPSSNEEGIHTMKYPRGSDTEVLLAFEGLADCIEFSRVIQEDPGMQHKPVPTPTQTVMMENACKDMNLPMKIVRMEEKDKEIRSDK
mmetsp:Transcript_10333/g.11067  ORF Transcript_10333/g.11067 Transcript_10333/m.11067 type:complete len:170 (+) Transcript_10333:163-672(+)